MSEQKIAIFQDDTQSTTDSLDKRLQDMAEIKASKSTTEMNQKNCMKRQKKKNTTKLKKKTEYK